MFKHLILEYNTSISYDISNKLIVIASCNSKVLKKKKFVLIYDYIFKHLIREYN